MGRVGCPAIGRAFWTTRRGTSAYSSSAGTLCGSSSFSVEEKAGFYYREMGVPEGWLHLSPVSGSRAAEIPMIT